MDPFVETGQAGGQAGRFPDTAVSQAWVREQKGGPDVHPRISGDDA